LAALLFFAIAENCTAIELPKPEEGGFECNRDLSPSTPFGKLRGHTNRMGAPNNNAEVADRFGVVAKRFRSVVDSASSMDRIEFAAQIYRILPKLIDEAISLPDVESSDSDHKKSSINIRFQEWDRLYNSLKEKLGDWNPYHQVFDPTQDSEAIFGSLADDIADIYGDLKKGLVFIETRQSQPDDAIWTWRVLFYSHWGQHAMNALQAIHFRLQNADFSGHS
jgi:hypothetical protein